uniref:CMRF35-like molecule 6 n=1 Tax=Astyanax mexicanus TaxID=7994 RepID=A0A3B1JTI9_ASTMX
MNITAVAFTLLAGLICVTSAGIRVKAPLGGNATVVCPYQKGSERYPKYFSKQRPGDRIEIARSNWFRTRSTDGRFSLQDDRERSEFTVIIRNLSVEDAGLYWCGVDWWVWSDELTEVNLDVVQEISHTSPTFGPQNASPSELMQTEPHPLLTQDKIPVTDQSMNLGVSLAVVVLLCGIMTVIFILIKKNNAKRSTDFSQPRICTQSNRDTCIYEEISPSDTCSSTNTTRRPGLALSDSTATYSTQSVLKPSAQSQVPHPESVVYSVITRPKKLRDDATPPPFSRTSFPLLSCEHCAEFSQRELCLCWKLA